MVERIPKPFLAAKSPLKGLFLFFGQLFGAFPWGHLSTTKRAISGSWKISGKEPFILLTQGKRVIILVNVGGGKWWKVV